MSSSPACKAFTEDYLLLIKTSGEWLPAARNASTRSQTASDEILVALLMTRTWFHLLSFPGAKARRRRSQMTAIIDVP